MNGRKVTIYGREFTLAELREHQQRRLEKAGADPEVETDDFKAGFKALGEEVIKFIDSTCFEYHTASRIRAHIRELIGE